jgi:hypothetical protein
MMDAHGLLLELEFELKVLADANNTHIGIGFAMNKNQVMVVEVVSEKPILVSHVMESGDGGVEARGIVINQKIGIYAARIASVNKLNKDIKVSGPQHIKYDKGTGEFSIIIAGPIENLFYCNEDPKLLQFYINDRPDIIQYGVETNERINVAHLKLCLSLPLEYIPDPRTIIEDAADQDKEEKMREQRLQKAAEAEKLKKAEKQEQLIKKSKSSNLLKLKLVELTQEMMTRINQVLINPMIWMEKVTKMMIKKGVIWTAMEKRMKMIQMAWQKFQVRMK